MDDFVLGVGGVGYVAIVAGLVGGSCSVLKSLLQ